MWHTNVQSFIVAQTGSRSRVSPLVKRCKSMYMELAGPCYNMNVTANHSALFSHRILRGFFAFYQKCKNKKQGYQKNNSKHGTKMLHLKESSFWILKVVSDSTLDLENQGQSSSVGRSTPPYSRLSEHPLQGLPFPPENFHAGVEV